MVLVVRHKINPFNIKAVMLDIPEPPMLTCAGSSESVARCKYQNIRCQFNFNRAGSHALHACTDPEHFVRGGSERGPKCH